MTITRLHAGPRMSQAVIHGSTIYLAGQVADQAKGKSVTDQTKEILATIERLLAEAGSDKTKILSTTIYLADIGTFAEMNAVWDAWVPVGHVPARATVEARSRPRRLRGSFYPLSHGASTCRRRITRPDFRPCSACWPHSQAPLCPYTRRTVSNRAEGTLGRLRYHLGGDRPSQTARLPLFRQPIRSSVRT